MWNPWRRQTSPQERQQRQEQRDDIRQDRRERFGDFGQFGVSSDELPRIMPEAVQWQERWAAEQRARRRSQQLVDWLLKYGRISGPAYDLFQVEFSAAFVPWVELDPTSHWPRRIYSAQMQRWFTPSAWEQCAQEMLHVGDPERVTMEYQTNPPALAYEPPPPTPAPASQWLPGRSPYYSPQPVSPMPAPPSRPWSPALDADPHLAPTPRMRVTPRVDARNNRRGTNS